jgi:hypothetical protein
MTIWNNLWPFGIVCGRLVYFSRFGMFGKPDQADGVVAADGDADTARADDLAHLVGKLSKQYFSNKFSNKL